MLASTFSIKLKVRNLAFFVNITWEKETRIKCVCHLKPSRHLLVQSQQWKQNNISNMFKVNNKDARKMSLKSFWFPCYFWTDFTYCSGVSIVDFEQVNVSWETAYLCTALYPWRYLFWLSNQQKHFYFGYFCAGACLQSLLLLLRELLVLDSISLK